jgi:hypothetical protein
VFFFSSTFLLLSGSAFQATSHDDAHDAFMTLPSYAFTREGEARHPGRGQKSCRVGAFAFGNALLHLIGNQAPDVRGGSWKNVRSDVGWDVISANMAQGWSIYLGYAVIVTVSLYLYLVYLDRYLN